MSDETEVSPRDFFQVKEDTAVIRHDVANISSAMTGITALLTATVERLNRVEVDIATHIASPGHAQTRQDLDGLHANVRGIVREMHEFKTEVKTQIARWGGGLAVVVFGVGLAAKFL